MQKELAKMLSDVEYDDLKETEGYREYTPRKMSKKEFVKEMLRLQQEKELYAD